MRLAGLMVLLSAFAASAASAAEPPKHTTSIDVIAVAPVDGVGLDRRKFPTNAQRIVVAESGDPAEILVAGAAGTETNNPGGGPLQADLQFRGFSVSSLLGAPQGLALFQDGVRLNEPFGDTIAWSTIPSAALESIEVIPGANPVFGLNALGGALTLRTRSSASESTASLHAGSFGRAEAEAATGGDRWFLAAAHLRDGGWRDHSPSEATRLFASTRWTSGDLRLTLARSSIVGNGAAPAELLDDDRTAVFTHPDETRNRTAMLALTQHVALDASRFVQGMAYVRQTRSRTFNGDDAPYEACGDFLCLEDDPVVDRSGTPVVLPPDGELDATNNRTALRQTAFGASVQLDRSLSLRGRANRLIAGVSVDGGVASFGASTELARLGDDRGTRGTGIVDAASIVDLDTRSTTVALFAVDVLTVTPRITITTTARAQHVRIRLDDRLGTALDGDHAYAQLHPSAGAAFELTPAVSAFANVALAGRTPTPVELSCADPEDPCRLPNAFVSDPPLRAVDSRTFEAGLRGTLRGVSWSAAAHHSVSTDDLIFISSGPARGEGHFANVGRTQRRGIEISAAGSAADRLQWSAHYAFLDATFESAFRIAAPHHPFAIDDEIAVERGDRLPLVPRHVFKLAAAFDVTPRVTLDASLRLTSDQVLRGDEANLAEPLPGYAVADARIAWLVSPRVRLVIDVDNLTNAEYATFGTFGDAEDVLGEKYADSNRFITPAAPRSFRAGIALRF